MIGTMAAPWAPWRSTATHCMHSWQARLAAKRSATGSWTHSRCVLEAQVRFAASLPADVTSRGGPFRFTGRDTSCVVPVARVISEHAVSTLCLSAVHCCRSANSRYCSTDQQTGRYPGTHWYQVQPRLFQRISACGCTGFCGQAACASPTEELTHVITHVHATHQVVLPTATAHVLRA